MAQLPYSTQLFPPIPGLTLKTRKACEAFPLLVGPAGFEPATS